MAERFTATSWRRRPEDGAFEFAYRCSRFGDFVETVAFPGEAASTELDAVGERLANLLHWTLGVSYFKAAAAPEIELAHLQPMSAGLTLMSALYRDGLGEFFVRNALPYPPVQRFAFSGQVEFAAKSAQPGVPAETRGPAVLAFGGGKDSHVALGLLDEANWPVELACVALSERIAAAISAMAPQAGGRELTVIRRTLDPRLIAVNKQGALNGHVPVTAINSLILVLYAHLTGAKHVIFANERSADEATLEVNGQPVNHQFSKSLRCEGLLRDAIAEAGSNVDYFSLLRPFSELWIARRLVQEPAALKRFRSCNANFVQAERDAPAQAWCGRCAKCAFTALITAPFLSRGESVALFGSDILNQPEAVEHLSATAGLSDARPWDCVGGKLETAAALARLKNSPRWADALAVKVVARDVVARHGAKTLERAWLDAFDCEGTGYLPRDFAWLCDDDAAG